MIQYNKDVSGCACANTMTMNLVIKPTANIPQIRESVLLVLLVQDLPLADACLSVGLDHQVRTSRSSAHRHPTSFAKMFKCARNKFIYSCACWSLWTLSHKLEQVEECSLEWRRELARKYLRGIDNLL